MEAQSGYVTVDGTDMYWESRGSGGPPLLLVHGGYGLASDFGELADRWARGRQVIAVELDGHGHTRRSSRPFRWETFGDDIAGVIQGLGLDAVDLLGYSLGGGASLRCAIQHPSLVRRLVLVSAPHRRDAWYPEVRAGFDGMSAATLSGQLGQSPLYTAWEKVAPDPAAFPALIDATGDLVRQPYDWSAEVAGLPMPVLLAYGDADSIPPSAAADFYGLLGGGKRDAGWDGSMRVPSWLTILPATHYDILHATALPETVAQFTA
jgi:pimeloyl-ACP methyl ester carboxylesterase